MTTITIHDNPVLALTLEQAAEAASMLERDIIDAIRAGDLTSRLHGHKILVLRPDLQAWLETLPVYEPTLQGVERECDRAGIDVASMLIGADA